MIMSIYPIPSVMPLLRRGPGGDIQDGGCFNQVAGYLADGHSWTDQHRSIHPVIRAAGVLCNDTMSNLGRPRLAVLAADAAGTGPEPTALIARQELTVRLVVWIAQQDPLHKISTESKELCRIAIEAALDWANCQCSACRTRASRIYWIIGPIPDIPVSVSTAVYMAQADAWAMLAPGHAVSCGIRAILPPPYSTRQDRDRAAFEFLQGLIREHQRLTGSTPVPAQHWDQVCELVGTTSEGGMY